MKIQKVLKGLAVTALLSACSTEQLQGPLTVGAALTAPLWMTVTPEQQNPCAKVRKPELALPYGKTLVAESCSPYKSPTVIGWIDNQQLLYRTATEYRIYTGVVSVNAKTFYPQLDTVNSMPCGDGKGAIYDQTLTDQEGVYSVRKWSKQSDQFEIAVAKTMDRYANRKLCTAVMQHKPYSPDSCRQAYHYRTAPEGEMHYSFLLIEDLCLERG